MQGLHMEEMKDEIFIYLCFCMEGQNVWKYFKYLAIPWS